MPAVIWQDPEKPRGKRDTPAYSNAMAAFWTVTESGLNAARDLRRQAATDGQFWASQKAEIGRFAKDMQRECQRMEKAATIWLRHFEDVGRKSILHMPHEIGPELDLVFGAMFLAEDQSND